MLFLPVQQPRPCAVFQMLSFKFVDKDSYHDIAQENRIPYFRFFVNHHRNHWVFTAYLTTIDSGLQCRSDLSVLSDLLDLSSMTDQFRHILDLARRTGDTMIVTDPDGGDVFVVMDLDKYESLLGTEIKEKDLWDVMKPANSDSKTWDMDEMNEQELAELEKQYHEFANKNVEKAIEENTPKIEEKPKEDDNFGEEEFYLEPVE